MSREGPLFSIVIPTYQRASVIQECVESVLNQDFRDFEIIVIDDGSTDNTKQVLEPICNGDSRLRYIFQENAERSNARNHGIRISTGEYICFLDSDDLFLQGLTENNFPVNMIYCDSKFEDGSQEGKRPLPTKENLIDLVMLHPIGAEQACIHQSILAKHKFDSKIRIGEDRELWFRIARECQLEYLDQCTIVIRDLGDRSVDIVNTWAYVENMTLIKHLGRIDTGSIIPRKTMRTMYSLGYYKLGLCYFKSNHRAKAFWNLMRSIITWPSHVFKYKVIFMLNILGLRLLLPKRLRDAY
jgi:glycosyltransferase involved in cell wall biosynthesis